MQVNYSHFSLKAGLLASAFVATLTSQGANPAAPDALPDPINNFIKLGVGGASISDYETAFQARTQLPKGTYGGIEELRLNRALDGEVEMQFDARLLAGSEDYLGHLKFVKADFGELEVGYKSFRTFYDGAGGFFPTNKAWRALADRDLSVDRAKFWAGIKLNLPDKPAFSLRYTQETRDGRKDSTIWGETEETGIPIYYGSGAVNTVPASRKIVPAYTDLDERLQTVEAAVAHTLGSTKVEAAIVATRIDNLDTRYMSRYPGALRPYPTLTATKPTLYADNKLANNEIQSYDMTGIETDALALHGKVETELGERVTLFGGFSYMDLDGDTQGDRQNLQFLNTKTGLVKVVGGFTSNGRPPYSYSMQSGSIESRVYTANIGAKLKPARSLFVEMALKAEDIVTKGQNAVTYLAGRIDQAAGTVTPVNTPQVNKGIVDETVWVPEVNVRYTGIQRLSLFGSFSYRYVPGDETGQSGVVSINNAPSFIYGAKETKERHGHYKVGANWAVNSTLTLRGEAFAKDHYNGFFNRFNQTDRFILYLDTVGIQGTAVFKPHPSLAFTTRLIKQSGKAKTTGSRGEKFESMDSNSDVIAETIDWTPMKQFYMQGSISAAFDSISTVYPRAGGVGDWVLHNADNNHVTASVLAGFVLSERSDLHLQYTRYSADNYQPALAYGTLPYGMSIEDQMFSAAFKVKLTENTLLEAKVGYYDSSSDTTGGFADFDGPVGFLSIVQSF